MVHVHLDGNTIIVQRGSYCACTPGVEVDSKWGGWSSMRAGEGLVMLKCSGSGELWLSSYGAIQMVEVQGTYVVDTSHIVAFDESLSYQSRSIGSLKSLFFSGEGRVVEFSGRGRLWFQTRSAPSLAEFLHPFRALKKSS